MKNTYWIIGIVVVVILVGGFFIFNNKQPTPSNQLSQTCEEIDGYCVYNNIPAGMKYFRPGSYDEDIIEKLNVNLSEYLIRDDSLQGLDDAFGDNWDSYTCISTGEPPTVVNYFYKVCPPDKDGCGHERKAIVCDDVYFIQVYSSYAGSRLLGPFEKIN